MPRPKRINLEKSWYHVFNRGISRKTICFSEYHYQTFLQLLHNLKTDYNVETHAYCMMKNHYHLLLFTHKANLSEAMWHLGRNFSNIVNKDIHGDGPVFTSRFKSIYIKDSRYLLQVHRYIHLNPTEANLCTSPEDYPWSSAHLFTSANPKSTLVNTDLLNMFRSPDEYQDFLNIGNSKSITNFYNRKNVKSVLDFDTI